jgi:hypothetical protein
MGTVIGILQHLSAFCAFIAAVLWLSSALVKLPDAIRHLDAGFIDDTQPKPVDDLDRLTSGLARQSRLSAMAALAAGLSALLQALTTAFG